VIFLYYIIIYERSVDIGRQTSEEAPMKESWTLPPPLLLIVLFLALVRYLLLLLLVILLLFLLSSSSSFLYPHLLRVSSYY